MLIYWLNLIAVFTGLGEVGQVRTLSHDWLWHRCIISHWVCVIAIYDVLLLSIICSLH